MDLPVLHSLNFAVCRHCQTKKGKSISAKGNDSSPAFILAKHKCFSKVHLMGGSLKDRKVQDHPMLLSDVF